MENQMLPCAYDLPMKGLDFLDYYAPHNVYHPGVDLNKGSGDQDCGNPVYSPKEATVEYINSSVFNGRGFGLFVILKHADGNYSRYAHLSKISALKLNQMIKKGEQIGNVGKTGTTYCHCHFEVMNEDCAKLQRSHAFKWAMYPSGHSKAWIEQHYLNPWEWLKTVPPISEWAKKSVETLKEAKIIENWSNPQGFVTPADYEFIFEKLGLKDPKQHKGGVTREELAVILVERLNILELIQAKKGKN